jgi:arabinose-5-phosphate isomerase
METIQPVELAKFQAGSIMTRNPITAMREWLAYDALQVMENRPSQIAVLPVVDADRRCVGLLRLHDIARSGLL